MECLLHSFNIMAESGLRFRRNVVVDNKEESVDLLTLALKRNAEYSKVQVLLSFVSL